MIVLLSTYNKALERAVRAEMNYYAIQAKWNVLIRRINEKGGEDFLDNATLKPKQQAQFTPDELTKLILLCHPDKHDGKTMATEMTQKLLALKGKS